MPEIKRVFNIGKMNRDLDDRIIPAGEYREAFNVNISQSEGSDVGAIENLLGNELVAPVGAFAWQFDGISGSQCIGSYKDNGNERIYFFVTSNTSYDETNPSAARHGIYEYNQKAKQLTTLVYTNQLNFHEKFPITGINFVDDLLFWTDNRNAPRKINVERARETNGAYYTSASQIDDLISVCKFAPYESASILSIGTTGQDGQAITSNFMQNKLLRFSYRWQFEDGEYSTLAPFTPICFSRLNEPDTISTDVSNFGEIETFVNAIKAVQLQVPTPQGFGITKVELVYKESNFSTLYVVADSEVTTEAFINFFYESQDPFRTIPPSQLTRVYDAVPRKALAQELSGGRLIYGNFLQNYDIPDLSFTVTRTGDSDARHPQLEYSSVKSRRTYQVGVVLADKFGRQSPVILSSNGKDTVYVDPNTGDADSTTAFNALRLTFNNTSQIPSWAYSYRIVVKQREQEYYNWISAVTAQDVVARLGDSINKIPRDQTAVIPPSTAASESPTNVSVYPKFLNGANVYSSPAGNLTKVQSINNPTGTANVTTVDNSDTAVTTGTCVYETYPVTSNLDIFYETSTGGLTSALTGAAIDIDFHNCILLSFDLVSNAHIEVNRIRAGYNEPFFDVGVRAYLVRENFAEERRFNTLIHSSGLFNSRTNINYINQFNESEGGLTVSLDPQNGGIQKLFADDTQVEIFQEDKVSRSPIDKDFIYSAEGGAVPVTSNSQFLGTIAPYTGQFGIASDPLSFASYGFVRYFVDRNRGVVLALAGGQIQEISGIGMSDFFRDALKTATKIIGSFDEYSRLYVLSIIGQGYDGNPDTNVDTASSGYVTLTFDNRAQGWSSFCSFLPESAVSLNNIFYSFKEGKLWQHHSEDVDHNKFYGGDVMASHVTPVFNEGPSVVKQFNTLNYEGTEGWDLSFVQTDLGSMGTTPTTATVYNTTLQLQGTAPNSTFAGSNTFMGKTGETAAWVIFVEPISSSYKFVDPPGTQIVLTPSAGSGLNITNPTQVTNGNQLVFYVTHTIGTTNTTQVIDITGTGASLAFTVALLTVNIFDVISNSSLTPAVNTFTSQGTNTITFATAANNGYYIEGADITINTSGMPSSTSPIGTPSSSRTNENLTYSITCNVPATATTGTITATGTATVKPTLTWAALTAGTGGILTTPVGTNVGVAYDTYPYDSATNRTATIVWTVTDDSKILLTTNDPSGNGTYAVTSSVAGASISSETSNQGGILTSTIVLPAISANTTATTTLNPATNNEATAALGTYATLTFISTSTPDQIVGDDAAEKSNVGIAVQSSDTWAQLNGAPGAINIDALGQFTVSVSDNNTGAARTATLTVGCSNSRIDPPLANKTITIQQA